MFLWMHKWVFGNWSVSNNRCMVLHSSRWRAMMSCRWLQMAMVGCGCGVGPCRCIHLFGPVWTSFGVGMQACGHVATRGIVPHCNGKFAANLLWKWLHRTHEWGAESFNTTPLFQHAVHVWTPALKLARGPMMNSYPSRVGYATQGLGLCWASWARTPWPHQPSSPPGSAWPSPSTPSGSTLVCRWQAIHAGCHTCQGLEKECCCHLTCGKGKWVNGPFLLSQDKAIFGFQ